MFVTPFSIWVVGLLADTVLAFSSFKANIPNGENVVRGGSAHKGVGHNARSGGGSLNPFGMAFSMQGKSWTKALCEMDSDGDGQTNGFELGDPDCIWSEGQTPARTTEISHPGFSDSISNAPTPTSAPTSSDAASTSDAQNTTNAPSTTAPTPRGANHSNQENCSTTVEGEECYHAVLWAKHHGIVLHPEWYEGLTHHSSFEEFQSLLGMRGMFACNRPCNLCHTAVLGERCHEEVKWAMLHGIRENPEWYPGLTSGASFEEFQNHLHNSGYSSCPEPCDLCRSAVEGEECYTDVAWAMEHGINLHPEWYAGLTRNSTREEFQAYLSNKFDCPRACGLCHTATAGEPCHEGVMWAMLHGIKVHPEWYPELAQNSSFEVFQEHLHEGKFMNCPRPCPA